MVRAPCCEKMGLKKGPWTAEEDQILVNYINQYGHGNWRALPKLAGLLRCGKSCRLRWTNYLRPDIKRGNFTDEEEETIIKLHEALGNRWSAIAARLPGRTDNEIKNVWHTRIKKRLKRESATHNDEGDRHLPHPKPSESLDSRADQSHSGLSQTLIVNPSCCDQRRRDVSEFSGQCWQPNSPPSSLSGSSTVTSTTDDADTNMIVLGPTLDYLPEVDDDFWSDVFSSEIPEERGEYANVEGAPAQSQNSAVFSQIETGYSFSSDNIMLHDDMEFWHDVLIRSEETLELPEF